jgi:hypothetical protein
MDLTFSQEVLVPNGTKLVAKPLRHPNYTEAYSSLLT